jgi:hypothetical protein
MDQKTNEVARRTAAALAAIKGATGTDEVALFISHHLQEIDESYWQAHVGTPRPSAQPVLDLLELRSHWGEADDDGIDTFDFTLPDDTTQHVIAVSFDEKRGHSGHLNGKLIESRGPSVILGPSNSS